MGDGDDAAGRVRPAAVGLRLRGKPLRNLFQRGENRVSWKIRLQRFLLDLDARIDFGLYQVKTWGRELYERFTVFMDRFHVAGWRRWVLVEPASEGFSLGTGGLILMLALAIPATGLHVTGGDNRNTPSGTEAADGLLLLKSRVGPGSLAPNQIVIDTGRSGSATAPETVAAELRLVGELRSELSNGNVDFQKVVSLADELGEQADGVAETFNNLNETLMQGLDRVKSGGGGRSRGSSSSSGSNGEKSGSKTTSRS